MNRIDNFNPSKPVNALHTCLKKPQYYLTLIVESYSSLTQEGSVYFVNNSDETLKYVSLGNPLVADVSYLEVLAYQAIKIDSVNLNDTNSSFKNYAFYLAGQYLEDIFYINCGNIAIQPNEIIPLLYTDFTKPAHMLDAHRIVHAKELPISPVVKADRLQWYLELINDYDKDLANFILACNDALYRYDIFTQLSYAYGMDLYDEYSSEAVALARKLIKMPKPLTKQQIAAVVLKIAEDYFDSSRGLHIEDDFIDEIQNACQIYDASQSCI